MMLIPAGLLLLLMAAVAASGQQPVFSARTDLVRVDVLVTDGRAPVAGLRATDFELFDNDVPQTIERVLTDDASLEAWLVLDESGSVRSHAEHLRAAAQSFVNGLRETDRVGLITFRHGVTLRSGLVSPDDLHVEPISEPAEGYTALRDAIATALMLRDRRLERALVLVLSDGADTMSWLTEKQLTETAERSDATMYALRPQGSQDVAAAGQGQAGPTWKSTASYLEHLAEGTGGREIRLHAQDLKAMFAAVLAEVRTRYVLTYYPSGANTPGWHHIRVRLKTRRAEVRARRGYFLNQSRAVDRRP